MRLSSYLAAGCIALAPAAAHAAHFQLQVSGYADGTPLAGTRYFLVPEQAQANASQFELAEYYRSIDRLLATRNMVRVSSPADADVVVSLAYGIAPETETLTDPVVHIPGQATTTSQAVAPGVVVTTTTTSGGTITGGGTFPYTIFHRFLRLVAVDGATLRTTNQVRERWRIEATSAGSSNDLRLLIPAMAYSLIPYVGTDTGTARDIKVKRKDKAYLAFLSAPITPPLPPSAPAAPPRVSTRP